MTAIKGIGMAVPGHWITQDDAAVIVEQFNCETDKQRQFLRDIYAQSGIDKRHSTVLERSAGPTADRQSFFGPSRDREDRGPPTAERMARYDTAARELSTAAAQQALERAGVDAADVAHLVTVSCTGFRAPGFDISLIRELRLRPETMRTQIGFMGCHGALNGFRVVRAYLAEQPRAHALMVATELCSLHQQYGWRPDQIVANALFADGSAAAVCGPNGKGDSWHVAATGSVVLPDSEDEMTWRIGDHGFEMTLSRRVPALIRNQLRPWLTGWLDRHGLSIASVPSWGIHPGGPRILSSAAEALGLTSEQSAPSESIFTEFGNMSSPTILFILDRLRQLQSPGPCVLLAFGPGVTCEAVLLV